MTPDKDNPSCFLCEGDLVARWDDDYGPEDPYGLYLGSREGEMLPMGQSVSFWLHFILLPDGRVVRVMSNSARSCGDWAAISRADESKG